MQRLLFLGVVLLGATAVLLAAEGDKPSDAARALRALNDEYRTAHDAFLKELASAKTDAAETKTFEDWQPKLERFNERYLELAKKYGNDPAAAAALSAVLEHSEGFAFKKGNPRRDVVLLLKENHLLSEALVPNLPLLARLEEPEAEQLLRSAVEKGATRSVRGAACYNLALALRHLHRRAVLVKSVVRSNPRAVERLEATKGSDYVERMLSMDTANLEKEREVLLERVAEDFTDVEYVEGGRTRLLGKVAEGILIGMRTLGIDKKVPEAESQDLDGKKVRLSDLKGKVVVLNFWATWCGPCRRLIPHEQKLVKKMEGRPFVFISISADEARETVKEFMTRQPMPWTHWHNGPAGDLLDSWQVSGFPTIYVIDAKGVLRYENVFEEEMDRVAEKLVKEAEEGSK